MNSTMFGGRAARAPPPRAPPARARARASARATAAARVDDATSARASPSLSVRQIQADVAGMKIVESVTNEEGKKERERARVARGSSSHPGSQMAPRSLLLATMATLGCASAATRPNFVILFADALRMGRPLVPATRRRARRASTRSPRAACASRTLVLGRRRVHAEPRRDALRAQPGPARASPGRRA